MRRLNRNERTIRAQVARLRSFFAFAAARGIMSCLKVDRQTILDYREFLAEGIAYRKRTVRRS